MRYLLAIYFFLLLPTSIWAQNHYYKKGQDPQIMTYQDWRGEQLGQWGSFYWKVTRSQRPAGDGFYYYYVYFYSNSYFNEYNASGQYAKAITYAQNVNLQIMGTNIIVHLPYALADWEETYVAYFYYSMPNAIFSINYGNVYPYSYSASQ